MNVDTYGKGGCACRCRKRKITRGCPLSTPSRPPFLILSPVDSNLSFPSKSGMEGGDQDASALIVSAVGCCCLVYRHSIVNMLAQDPGNGADRADSPTMDLEGSQIRPTSTCTGMHIFPQVAVRSRITRTVYEVRVRRPFRGQHDRQVLVLLNSVLSRQAGI